MMTVARPLMTDTAYPDEVFMAHAIRLAWKGLYTTMPNPRVGCVLVKEGRIIGEGWHQQAGQPHAEINALRNASESVAGATAYVTLEPCSHHGRTGPCCEALVKADVARLVVAMKDPNPQVAGRGLAHCSSAGLDIRVGVCESDAQELNPGFVSRMSRGLPWVTVKLASSLDGRTAMASGESQWITGPAARRQVQRLRARSSAILCGVDALISDDSRLTVRPEQAGLSAAECGPAPLRVVVDSHLRMPVDASMLSEAGRTLVVTRVADRSRQQPLVAAGAEIRVQPGDSNASIDLHELMQWLAQHEECNDVLVESGARLAGAFLEADLIDELVLFQAPTLLGSSALPLFDIDIKEMRQQRRLVIKDIRAVGDDWYIIARPEKVIPAAKA